MEQDCGAITRESRYKFLVKVVLALKKPDGLVVIRPGEENWTCLRDCQLVSCGDLVCAQCLE